MKTETETTNPNVQVRVLANAIRLQVYMPEHDDFLMVTLTPSYAFALQRQLETAMAELDARL